MKFLIAKKLEMTQVFTASGKVVPVTKVIAGPCLVVQKKELDVDGYHAVKCAFNETKKVNKPLLGIFKKFGSKKFKTIKEFKIDNNDPILEKVKPGDLLTAEIFSVGDKVTVTGTSKGKGFQGVVKRHGFSGGPASHGHKDQLRMPGSIGATGPARVFKGVRMGGHMGDEQITLSGLEIIEIEADKNILYLKGALPGARNSILKIYGKGDFEIVEKKVPQESVKQELEKIEKEEVQENVQNENDIKENETKKEEIK